MEYDLLIKDATTKLLNAACGAANAVTLGMDDATLEGAIERARSECTRALAALMVQRVDQRMVKL